MSMTSDGAALCVAGNHESKLVRKFQGQERTGIPRAGVNHWRNWKWRPLSFEMRRLLSWMDC